MSKPSVSWAVGLTCGKLGSLSYLLHGVSYSNAENVSLQNDETCQHRPHYNHIPMINFSSEAKLQHFIFYVTMTHILIIH